MGRRCARAVRCEVVRRCGGAVAGGGGGRGGKRAPLRLSRAVGDAARDDQRHARLVDEHAVALVHHAEVERGAHHLVAAHGEVVAQEVEAELLVGHVLDVARVGLAPLLGAHARLHQADAQPEELVHLAHDLGITPCQVVVDRDEVAAALAC